MRDRAVRAELKKLREAAAAEDANDPDAPPININDLREAVAEIHEEMLQVEDEKLIAAGAPPSSPRLFRTLSRTTSMNRGSAKFVPGAGGRRRSRLLQPRASFLVSHAESPTGEAGPGHSLPGRHAAGPASPKTQQSTRSPLDISLGLAPRHGSLDPVAIGEAQPIREEEEDEALAAAQPGTIAPEAHV